MAGHFQHLSATVHVVLISLEGGIDHAAFKVRHGFDEAQVEVNFHAGVIGLPQAHFHFEIRQARRLHLVGLLENGGAFHHVAQFAHIAGPVVPHQFF